MTRLLLTAVVLLGALAGCRGQTTRDEPIVPIRNMHQQPRYSWQAHSDFYADGRVQRMPPVGTIAREMEIDPVVAQGMDESGVWVPTIPEPVVARKGGMEPLLARGHERYGIYCVPCHDALGTGRGMVQRRGGNAAFSPPTFHDDRIRHMPDGQLYATISNGIRNMPAYYAQIPVDDRWAIVAYVRALQISQARQASARPANRPEGQ